MIKPELLATLTWRGLRLTPAEFFDLLAIDTQPENLKTEVSRPGLREFLRTHEGWWAEGERELEWLVRRGANLAVLGQADYPLAFLKMEKPPLALCYWGTPFWKRLACLSIVGSRYPSAGTLSWLNQQLRTFLAERELGVVSGAARGVDQAAHAVSLRAGRPTLAFLPAGLSSIYPPSFEIWIEKIVAGGGAVVSQFSPFQQVFRSHFYERNALIAAMSPLLLVAEGRRKSGSLLTAQRALELDRVVSALPFFPFSGGDGSLDLIQAGAFMIRDFRDLLVLWDQVNLSPSIQS